jgi:hypothetical protein
MAGGWFDRFAERLGVDTTSRAYQGSRMGGAAGLPGALIGWGFGKFQDARDRSYGANALDRNLGNTIASNAAKVDWGANGWGSPVGSPLMETAEQGNNWYSDQPSAPTADELGLVPDYGSGVSGPMAGGSGGDTGGGMGGGGGMGAGGMLVGGGMDNVMNGASASMLSDFAATTNGDWTQRLQSHVGAQGPNATAKKR